jgi:hypothetical protein
MVANSKQKLATHEIGIILFGIASGDLSERPLLSPACQMVVGFSTRRTRLQVRAGR